MAVKDQIVPKGAMLLHTPWIDVNGKFHGRIENPKHFIQCTHENEIEGLTPVVADLYLSWAPERSDRRPPIFTDVTYPAYAHHKHEAHHDHYWPDQPMRAASTVRMDRDDGGKRTSMAGEFHTHDISLNDVWITTKYQNEDDTPKIYEPKHNEVNAYWVREDALDPVEGIPIGTFAFIYEGDEVTAEAARAWRSTSRPGKRGEPSRWIDSFLKVVGCWPNQATRGSNFHVHDDLHHEHASGTVGSNNTTSTGQWVDNSSDDDSHGALRAHSHPDLSKADIGPPTTHISGPGDSRPHNIALELMVSLSEDAKWLPGMIIPFVPKDASRFDPANLPEGWQVVYSPDNRDTALHIRIEPEVRGEVSEPNHRHEYLHGHHLTIGAAGSTASEENDNEVIVSGSGHRHNITLMDPEPIFLSEAPNIVPFREVVWIRYVGY